MVIFGAKIAAFNYTEILEIVEVHGAIYYYMLKYNSQGVLIPDDKEYIIEDDSKSVTLGVANQTKTYDLGVSNRYKVWFEYGAIINKGRRY